MSGASRGSGANDPPEVRAARRTAVHVDARGHEAGEPGALTAAALVFDAAFLRKLEHLELLARKVFRGHLRGEHASRRRGSGVEFFDFRRYRPGDDVRYVDWNIYSRLDRLFLKLYTSEEEVTLHVLVDTSASMGFGEPVKLDHARRVAAALAYIGLANRDRVGVETFADALGPALPPLRSKRQMPTVLAYLASLAAGGRTRFARAMREAAARLGKPGLVVVISDFLGDDGAAEGLAALRNRGHEVVALQLLGEDEIDPPLDRALELVDAEDGSALRVTVDVELRELYRARLAERLDALAASCRSARVEYLRASTAIAFEDIVLRYLRQGQSLR